jgi:hypothetical protein
MNADRGKSKNLPLIDTDNTDRAKLPKLPELPKTARIEKPQPLRPFAPTMVFCKPFHLHSQRLIDPVGASVRPGFETQRF